MLRSALKPYNDFEKLNNLIFRITPEYLIVTLGLAYTVNAIQVWPDQVMPGQIRSGEVRLD